MTRDPAIPGIVIACEPEKTKPVVDVVTVPSEVVAVFPLPDLSIHVVTVVA